MIWRSIRENIEALTVAILLALLIRHFVFESYEIPTGSMAPGLNGLHVTVPCPNCQTDNHVGIHSDSLTNNVKMGNRIEIYQGICPNTDQSIKISTLGKTRFQCPSCEDIHPTSSGQLKRAHAISMRVWCQECTYRFPVVAENKDILGGNKIIVDKFSYDWAEPKRWDVVVFRFNRERNYIKRLVGLPGENIRVKYGDVWINDSIEAKPIGVQEHFWTPIHDSTIKEQGLVESAWDSTPGWVRTDDGWDFNQIQGEGSLRYVRTIENKYNYNSLRGSGARASASVRDLEIQTTFRATPEPGNNEARFYIGIQNHPSEYRWSFPFKTGEAQLELLRPDMPPTILATVGNLALSPDVTYQITAQIVDRKARLFVNGDLRSDTDLPASEVQSGTTTQNRGQLASSVSISAKNCGGTIQQIKLSRDQHWTLDGNYAISSPYPIDANRYFVMGDNSPSSLDSRYWGSFARTNLLGRGFTIFWPALPGRNEIGFIR
ncbi:MAG: signal peptidase I [Planctomycetota bacterium]